MKRSFKGNTSLYKISKSPKIKQKKGNPYHIKPEIYDKIIELVSSTDRPLSDICKDLKIDQINVYRQMGKSKEFCLAYLQARAAHTEISVQKLDEYYKEIKAQLDDNTTDPKIASALVQAFRVRSDNIRWAASKLLPGRYGERVQIDAQVNINPAEKRLNAWNDYTKAKETATDADSLDIQSSEGEA